MMWGGLSSVCTNLETARSKSDEILEINVLQKARTSHAVSYIWSMCVQNSALLNLKNNLFIGLLTSCVNSFKVVVYLLSARFGRAMPFDSKTDYKWA